MIIRMTVFWTMCTQNFIAMYNLIAQFKWRYGGVFQWRISQSMQRNRRMNALTSKLWWGGGEAKWPSNHFRLYTVHCICTEAQETCLIGRVPRHDPRIFSRSGMLNRKFGLPWVHCIIHILQFLLSCVHCVIQIAQFEWSFKLRTLLSCENSLWLWQWQT